MTINTYEVGDSVNCTVTFFAVDGITLVDPTTITFSITEPDAVVTPYTFPSNITKTGTGAYLVVWPVTKVGNHSYQFHGAATGYARTFTRTFIARPTAFT